MPARFAAIVVVAFALCAACVFWGGAELAPSGVLAALAHPGAHDPSATIVWQLRVPRVVIGMVVGASLAVAGALLQGMLRNPLVDPYLTGVSAGAACAIAIAILVGIAAPFLPALGFAAGLGSATLATSNPRCGPRNSAAFTERSLQPNEPLRCPERQSLRAG